MAAGDVQVRAWSSSHAPLRAFLASPSAAATVALVAVVIAFSLLDSQFLSLINLDSIAVAASIDAIVGFGMTFVIAMRSLDLSVGSIMGFTAIVVAQLLNHPHPLGLALLCGLGVGIGLGLANGLLVVGLRLPSFVATLATLSMIYGGELLLSNGQQESTSSNLYSNLVIYDIGGYVPVAVVIALAILGLMLLLFHRTPFGRHVAAVGGSVRAAIDAGINVKAVTLGAFIVSGVCAAIGGMMTGGELQTVDSTVGRNFELTAIAVVVVGGTSLTGGRGNLIGTAIAALLLESIHAGLLVLNVSSLYVDLVFGGILLAALMFDGLRRRDEGKVVLVT
jgi:ribose transport system permease protein